VTAVILAIGCRPKTGALSPVPATGDITHRESVAAQSIPPASASADRANGGDAYAQLIARASAGDRSVDFHSLRLAYLKSSSRLLTPANLDEITKLRQAMVDSARDGAHARVAEAARKIISLVFIDMAAHKFLRQSCALLKDDACAERHHFVQFGLLRSVTGSGDGKSCETGWEVVTRDEEYFILAMLGANLEKQRLTSGGGYTCDEMQVTMQGQRRSYFFRVDALLAEMAGRLER
jgi:hypothetical protein